MKTPIVMSWSGGKDSTIALHELLQTGEYDVVSLMTSLCEEYRRISHHGVREALLEEQARAIGIPLERFVRLFDVPRIVYLRLTYRRHRSHNKPRKAHSTPPAKNDTTAQT